MSDPNGGPIRGRTARWRHHDAHHAWLDRLRSAGTLQVGTWAECRRTEPSEGTWPRYEGKVGRIVAEVDTVLGAEIEAPLFEYEVQFPKRAFRTETPVTAWFYASELIPTTKPRGAESIRVRR